MQVTISAVGDGELVAASQTKLTMTDDARTPASTYFRAWKAKDFATLRSVLAGNATFRGPFGNADDAETSTQGLKGMAQIRTGLRVNLANDHMKTTACLWPAKTVGAGGFEPPAPRL